MTKIAFVFPGQGSQTVGMGAEFVASSEKSKAFYEQADAALGSALSALMLHGPQEDLTVTYHAQPALLTTGVMIASKLIDAGITPDFTAGHSLGEYSAFVTSGVMSFHDAVGTVHKRGLFMNEAVPAGKGAMAAILSLDAASLQAVCEQVTLEGEAVQVANINCPGQLVISGTKRGVELASIAAKEAGAKRAIALPVSGPFHSTLMAPAAEQLALEIDRGKISQPRIPVISNVTSTFLQDAHAIREEMVAQVVSPVNWQRNVEVLIEQGVTIFIECGPGKVLSGLIKKINRQVQTYCVHDEASFAEVVEAAKGWKQWV